MAPGASGLGTSTSGSPASGVDNYSTEEQVDASANGQGQNNNQYVVDGLDVTSGIRQGVLNLTPQPESIQETSVQVNTYSVEHSRAAGLQTIFTTRSGYGSIPRIGSRLVQLPGDVREPAFRGLSVPAIPLQQHGFCDRRSDRSAPQQLFLFRRGTAAFVGQRRRIGDVCGSAVHFLCGNQLSQHRRNAHLQTYPTSGIGGASVQQTAAPYLAAGGWLRHNRGAEWRSMHSAYDRHGSFGAHRSETARNISPVSIRVSRRNESTSASSGRCCRQARPRPCLSSRP